ncbi:hypothetical protein Val02_66570 [Virgisporangium aliadipatigenens]|uniref:Uncharacterized protein n=1 Tax=Virgisporangium aliadipatigenens TaxID=741659 RepID=A0A8J3YQU8_9ACTN|nr:hypothetical protein [Virgisporangium aliadipatigenens]GIJ49771.1 hypothetical protein Val02_66570 [Virgisporangium aliadipatigenens]
MSSSDSPVPTASDPPSILGATLLNVLVAAGVFSIVGYYLYWCQQSGYFGAFSVSLEQVGVSGSVQIQRASLLVANLLFGIAAIGMIWALVHFFKHGIKANWDKKFNLVVVSVLALLHLGIIAQLVADHNWTRHIFYTSVALVAASGVLVGTRRLWKEIEAQADESVKRRFRAYLVAASAASLLGVLGFATNAWFYNVGTTVREQGGSRFGYLVGISAPHAEVVWRSPSTDQCTEGLLLGEASAQYVVYCLSDGRVYYIPRVDARVITEPKS